MCIMYARAYLALQGIFYYLKGCIEMKKRVLCLALVLVMILTVFPMAAMADYTNYEGGVRR